MMMNVGAVRMLTLAFLALMGSVGWAASITVQVVDASGQALANSAVYAEPLSVQAPSKAMRSTEIAQKARTFLPLVTVVQTGTAISFPNNDTIRHHVYSFSPAKKLDMKLYSGLPAGPPETFDKAGTVVVGCNIHDRMIAYIHVVDTPYFAKTDAYGNAKIDGVALGKFRLKAWHFSLASGEPVAEQLITLPAGGAAASFKLKTAVARPSSDPHATPASPATY